MKTLKLIFFAGLLAIPFVSVAQEPDRPDSTGMPGDNFDLRGALDLFEDAESPEGFEKALNSESNKINNLDLDGDDKIDYIRVIDRVDGKSHAIVMQVAVNEKENQDIAVITIEQTAEATAQLQIVGNETVYGEEVVIEPYEEVDEPEQKKKGGPSMMNSRPVVVFVNCWLWPCVMFMYGPVYTPYISPWHWGFYPTWFVPWRPVYVSHYHAHVRHHYHHHRNYRPVATPTLHSAHAAYRNNTSVSKSVENRYASSRESYQARKTTTTPANSGRTGQATAKQPATSPAGKASPATKQPATSPAGKTTPATKQPTASPGGKTPTTQPKAGGATPASKTQPAGKTPTTQPKAGGTAPAPKTQPAGNKPKATGTTPQQRPQTTPSQRPQANPRPPQHHAPRAPSGGMRRGGGRR